MRPLIVALLALAAPLSTSAAVDAKELFLDKCAKCHGEKGDADTELGARYMAQDFTDPEFKQKYNVDKVKKVITNGVKKTKMKSWKNELSKEQIDALARHVLSFPAAKPAESK
jgi:mono/diheme cytochrome c family protein